MVGHVRAWVIWWLLCAALWLLLVDRTPLDELLAGAGVAALGATAAVAVRARQEVLLRPRARWLTTAWRPVLGMFADLVPLVRVLVTRGILRRDERGSLSEVPYPHVGADGQDTAHRALTEALGSLAPNTFVVDIDRDRGVLLAHELAPTGDVARSACPLGGEGS
jgi:multisubunit Na+/H+ antiporter MnhE subunit